jgi:iron complex outermembrane receptor protein
MRAAQGWAESRRRALLAMALLFGFAASDGAAQAGQIDPAPSSQSKETATLRVEVRSDTAAISQAVVDVAGTSHTTNDEGILVLTIPVGLVQITASKEGFPPVTTSVRMVAGLEQRVVIELTAPPALDEEVTVVASTRTERRIEDQAIRVEVVPQEEIDEKVFMTPGDISMMLTETNGLRVQMTSPSLGAANVRVQGLRGRYTQVLADGLPLYGQAGSIGVLQIPPMDLGQVEVIKGVASALYGGSALGGVINLVSRRPQPNRQEREVLVNRTSRGGTDTVIWLSDHGSGNWGYTLLGGGHWQERNDVDHDGWTDLPSYNRAVARPRVTWQDEQGRSVFFTVGGMAESREGGTMPDAVAPDGSPFPENLNTRRFDAGLVARFPTRAGRIVTFRTSGLGQWHHHQFGGTREHDLHHTWFAETAMTGTSGPHTWVLGAALQRDRYRHRELPEFDYTFVAPGFFAQDDYSPRPWLTMSASARVDVHNEFGTFFSPRISALFRSQVGWTLRLSSGTGFYAPTPFTEETEATGLSRLAPLGLLQPERGRSFSLDLGWKRGSLEVTGTVFHSVIDEALVLRDTNAPAPGKPVEIVNSTGATRTAGSELIARWHRDEMDLIATYMYVWATEPDPNTQIHREVPLNARHTAGIDWLWSITSRVRLGVELFYTGVQQLDDSPYLERSRAYLLAGFVAEWRIGRARLFVNTENLGDFRQTRYEPLVRPTQATNGLWTVDVWGPLEGRIVNGGVRVGF